MIYVFLTDLLQTIKLLRIHKRRTTLRCADGATVLKITLRYRRRYFISCPEVLLRITSRRSIIRTVMCLLVRITISLLLSAAASEDARGYIHTYIESHSTGVRPVRINDSLLPRYIVARMHTHARASTRKRNVIRARN